MVQAEQVCKAIPTCPVGVVLADVYDAWVEPDGTWHYVDEEMHWEWAMDNRGVTDTQLLRSGWMRLSSGWFDFAGSVSQSQFDFVWDWYVATGGADRFDSTRFPIR